MIKEFKQLKNGIISVKRVIHVVYLKNLSREENQQDLNAIILIKKDMAR